MKKHCPLSLVHIGFTLSCYLLLGGYAVDPFAGLSLCDIYVLIFIITLNPEQLAFRWMNETD